MSMNNKNTQMPMGKKFKVTYERNGEKDFMVLYAQNVEDAKSGIVEAWQGARINITNVEEA